MENVTIKFMIYDSIRVDCLRTFYFVCYMYHFAVFRYVY